MKNLFDKPVYEEVIKRLNTLTPQSQRKWGGMEVAQMVAHCNRAFGVPLTEKKLPRAFIGILLGWAFKKKLYDDSPWKQGLPTSPDFKIKDQRDFEKEKQQLTALLIKFYELGPEKVGNFPHPILCLCFSKFANDTILKYSKEQRVE